MPASRRDKGEGSIYKRSDGKWVAAWKAPNKLKPKIFYGKTEQEVKKKLREYKKEVQKYDFVEIQKISVREYMDDWFRTVKVNELKPKSFDRQESTLEHQVYPYIGDIQIAFLTVNDVQKMINDLVKKELSYESIKKAYDSVNSCFKLAIIKGDVVKNPCIGVSLPRNMKKKKGDIRFFEKEQVDRICEESVKGYSNGKLIYRLGHSIIVLMYTGMRIGELLGLKWKDINYDKATAIVTDSVVMIKNREEDADVKYKLLVQDSVKTESSDRIIHLNKKAIAALQEIQKFNGKFEYVMANTKGKITEPRNIDRMLRNILERCNLEPCGVHVLRHTYASMLFRNGIDVKTVSELLGHSDVTVTYNTYIHLIKEQKHQAVTTLDDFDDL